MSKQNSEIVKTANEEGRYPVLASAQRVGSLLKEALAGEALSVLDLDRLKVPAGGGTNWSLTRNGEEESPKAIRGVIVHHNVIRLYWPEAYGGGNDPPACTSRDGRVGVGTPGGDCRACPLAAFGTKRNADGSEGRGQACQQRRLLFLLMEGEQLPRVISIPPTGLLDSRKYILGLVRDGLSHQRVTTELGLVKAQNPGTPAFSKVTFRMAGRLSEAEAEKAVAYGRHIAALMGSASVAELETEGEDGNE